MIANRNIMKAKIREKLQPGSYMKTEDLPTFLIIVNFKLTLWRVLLITLARLYNSFLRQQPINVIPLGTKIYSFTLIDNR